MSRKDKNIEENENKPVLTDEEKRSLRKKKKKKARIRAFIFLVILLAILGAGGYFGSRAAISYIDDKEAQEAALEAQAEEEARKAEEEAAAIAALEALEAEEEAVPTPEITPEPTEEEIMEEMIESMIESMTLEEKVAGMFIVTPEDFVGQNNVTKAGDGTKAALEKYAVGGIIYSKGNLSNGDQVSEMISNTISYSRYPLFIAIDEEGGNSFLQAALKLDAVISPKKLAEAGDSSTTYENYKTIGSYLAEYGFNLDIAPSADVLTDTDKAKLGEMTFGMDASADATYVAEAVKGLSDAGVWSCTKHFPGEGGADGDTQTSLADMGSTLEDLRGNDLLPFISAIEAGTDMIMVSHESAQAITGDTTPCSMSKEIMTDLIRGELDYNGIIITDAMNVSSITNYYTSDEVAVKAIKAGADMVLAPEDFETAYNAVLAAVEDGSISEERINDALRRIYRVKYENALGTEEEGDQEIAEETAELDVTE